MPLNKTCSVDAFRENIRAEINAGKSPSQATAIARSTLDAACTQEGKPVPEPVAKKKTAKKRSREYLEAALAAAKKMLPGWQYQVLHRAAFPSSGGNAKANRRRMTVTDKLWIEKTGIGQLSSAELKSMLHKLNVTLAAYKRQGKDTKAVLARAKSVTGEMKKRGLKLAGGAARAVKEAVPTAQLPIEEKFKKGFFSGEPEGGMHAHGLDRLNGKTLQDGHHLHLFVIPGSGEVLVTEEDGGHAHEIDPDGNVTANDGPHSHRVHLSDGRMLETKLGGDHAHQLMVETSGFDGLHKHALRLPDGTEVQSLSPGEFAARFVDIEHLPTGPIFCSREITAALNEARAMRERMFQDDMPVAEAVAMMAKEDKLPPMPHTVWEVDELAVDGAHCKLADMESTVLAGNPNKLHLAPGDVVELDHEGVIVKWSGAVEAHTFDDAAAVAAYVDAVQKATRGVPFIGPQSAPLLFVAASPSPLELARGEPLVGPDGALFAEQYLTPLGLAKNQVAVGFAVPVRGEADVELWRDRLLKSVALYSNAKVVALGRVAKDALGPLVSYTLPHPAALRRHGDTGEVTRKLKTIRRELDKRTPLRNDGQSPTDKPIQGKSGATLADSISELSKGGSLRVPVIKVQPEKQIVYGVILDPYQIDLHDDWIPPAEIEATAHDFLAKSRVIGLRHKGRAEAEVVESWVELYPSTKDRDDALQNLPHSVFRREFGSDVLHSGAWVAGVRLSDELWALHKRGELDAFSIGGFSFKTQITTNAMPKVDFVDLQPAT